VLVPAAFRNRRPSPLAVDSAVTLLLLALFLTQLTTHVFEPGQRSNSALTYLLALAMVAPFPVHRRAPLLAAAIILGALLAYSLAHYGPYPGINAFVLLFGVALHSERRRSLLTFVATLAVLSVAVWVQPGDIATTSTWVSTLLFAAVSWLVGENLRQRRVRWAALEERARFLEAEREERARQAVVEERLRIARELHDVVAHSMSVIAVQSGVGHHVIDTQPEEARRALAAIETTSRSALVEMRRLLGVLRQEGQPYAALAPAPGLGDLPQLMSQLEQAGLPVTLTVTGDLIEVPVPVDLTAYRIVQEALTNALKHGGPAATVTIVYRPDEICVDITDDGAGRSARRPSHGEPAGHGLIGMRERVAVFGGELTAGVRPGGGFRVAVRLPLTEDHP
jgi:signal transduction histidine kinase